jgi:hypothetical protein
VANDARGTQAEGKEDSDECRTTNKRLDITLLRKGWHEVSVFDTPLDHRMPAHMKSWSAVATGRGNRATPRPAVSGWSVTALG